MENGTVIWKRGGEVRKAEIKSMGFKDNALSQVVLTTAEASELINEDSLEHPEPFSDGEYLHYTRFHPQLKDMIGTEGYFYDIKDTPILGYRGNIIGVSDSGYPLSAGHNIWAYFAVPIEQPKTEITLQEIADQFGVPVQHLRIKE